MTPPGSLLKERFEVVPGWPRMSLPSAVFANMRDEALRECEVILGDNRTKQSLMAPRCTKLVVVFGSCHILTIGPGWPPFT